MATKYYLDKTGLTHFWDKIKTALAGKQDKLTAGDGIDITNNEVSLDYLTLANAFKTWSGTTAMATSYASVLSVDISDIPTGSDFFVFTTVTFTGSTTLTATAVRASYNSQYSVVTNIATTWGRSVVNMWKYTKVSGQNSLTIQAKKDNSSTVNATNCVCAIIQAGKWVNI